MRRLQTGPTVEQLRQEVRAAIEEAGSSYPVAPDAGVSPSGLRHFAEGSSGLYRATTRRLLAWYARREASRMQAPDPAAVRAAVDILVRDLEQQHVDAAVVTRVREEMATVLAARFAGRQGADEMVRAALGKE